MKPRQHTPRSKDSVPYTTMRRNALMAMGFCAACLEGNDRFPQTICAACLAVKRLKEQAHPRRR